MDLQTSFQINLVLLRQQAFDQQFVDRVQAPVLTDAVDTFGDLASLPVELGLHVAISEGSEGAPRITAFDKCYVYACTIKWLSVTHGRLTLLPARLKIEVQYLSPQPYYKTMQFAQRP